MKLESHSNGKEDHFIFNYEYLLKSNEVKSSYHMEKEGFVRSMDLIKSKGLKIAELVTDRHAQIVKYAREEMPNTKHYFDVWHVAKGI